MVTTRLAYTPGEPAGIGPDLIIQIVQQGFDAEIVAICDPNLLKQRATILNLPLTLREYESDQPPRPLKPGELVYLPLILSAKATPGQLNQANAQYVLNSLDIAINGCLAGDFDPHITAKTHKRSDILNHSCI